MAHSLTKNSLGFVTRCHAKHHTLFRVPRRGGSDDLPPQGSGQPSQTLHLKAFSLDYPPTPRACLSPTYPSTHALERLVFASKDPRLPVRDHSERGKD